MDETTLPDFEPWVCEASAMELEAAIASLDSDSFEKLATLLCLGRRENADDPQV
jgi:hypothetical protein